MDKIFEIASSAHTIITSLSNLSICVLTLFIPFFIGAVLILSTLLYTTIRYRLSLANYAANANKPPKPQPPPYIPYSIPILGTALSFLAPRPGLFWAALFRSHPRSTGCATLLLGGRETHIIFSETAVQSLFKNKTLGREGFNRDIVTKGIGLTRQDADAFFGFGEPAASDGLTPRQAQEKMNHDFLMRTDRVNELTSEFTRILDAQLKSDLGSGSQEIGIYEFLQPRMFAASTSVFMGDKILEICPDLRECFLDFDRVMLTLFFGIPRWIAPSAYKIRTRVLDSLERFHVLMYEKYHGKPVDPEGEISWEPDYGSRGNRARQVYYERRGMNMRSRGGMDLGFLFGLSSNAIPATGWILMHLLDPNGDKTVLPRILDELETARVGDEVDIPTLCALPLLQSVFQEVLRLYMDAYVTRELKEELVLPLGEKSHNRNVLFGANSIIMAPSFVCHRDDSLWTSPSSSIFFAERFLKLDPATGKVSFTTGNTNGKFFPFGGGRTICPGRVFAKQEVLASVAMMLLTFEFEVLGFVDNRGICTGQFPTLRESYGGSGIMAADGDVKVRMRRRRRE